MLRSNVADKTNKDSLDFKNLSSLVKVEEFLKLSMRISVSKLLG